MKKLILIALCFRIVTASAQKLDNVWLLGYHYYPSFVAALDFYYGSPDTIGWNAPIDFWRSNASICSPTGDMLFYTNGVVMCNYLNDTLDGSLDFNFDSAMGAPYYIDNLPSQSVIILPRPGHANEFGVFHMSMNVFNNSQNAQPIRMSASIVDMNANNGLGMMTVKNQVLFTDTILYNTMQATKHGNGRDWWVLAHRWNSNRFYKMLFTPFGIDTSSQAVGPTLGANMGLSGQSVFSPDGSRFALLRPEDSKVYLFDFDRCSGWMQLIETLEFDSTEVVTGCSFSPNSNLFYVNTYYDLYQYDLSFSPTAATQIHIASWDGAGSFNGYYFMMHRSGPDGKTYVITPPSEYMHQINDPDQPDTLCNFTQHSFRIKAYHSGYLPEFPNYRLGNVPGSLCDSLNYLSVAESETARVSVYPNPATDYCEVNYDLQSGKEGRITLLDASGRIVSEEKLPMWSTRYTFDTGNLSAGVYTVHIFTGKSLCRERLVVMK